MIKYILLTTIILLFGSFKAIDINIVGHWKGSDSQEIGEMDFDKDGYFSYTRNGKKRGGKDFKASDRITSTYYYTYTKSKPYKIDVVVKLNGSDKDETRLVGIYEVINKNQLKICFNFEGLDRPKNFLSTKDIMILNRIGN